MRTGMAAFQFELVSPDKLLFRGPAESVLVPGGEGDFLVLKDHAPVMAALRPGVVSIADTQGKETRYFVRGGFADVNPAGLIVLAETAIPAQDLNAERLTQEIKNAEEDVADASEDARRVAQEKLDRLRELKDSLKL
jgi:F-type H+-transporting ATPase subunit epsilon